MFHKNSVQQDTKDDAADAKVAAEKARREADEVEAKIKTRNQNIRDLIRQIKSFLTGNTHTGDTYTGEIYI